VTPKFFFLIYKEGILRLQYSGLGYTSYTRRNTEVGLKYNKIYTKEVWKRSEVFDFEMMTNKH
jgi:hypothetical protein